MSAHFDSLSAFAKAASQATHDERSSAWDTTMSKEHARHSWTLGVDLPHAVTLARHGWPEGAARAKRVLDSIKLPPVTDTHSVTFHDVQGSYVDVGEYVQGVPECMIDFRQDRRSARFVNIVVCGGCRWDIPAEQIMLRGCAIAAVVDTLESQGIRCGVELRYVTHAWFSGEPNIVSVTLKRPEEPLNLDVLAFATAHPAMYRRLTFAVLEQEPEEARDLYGFYYQGGYGTTRGQIAEEPGTITFQAMQNEKWTEQLAAEYAKAAVEAYVANEEVAS